MAECKECGHDRERGQSERATHYSIEWHLRHALNLACGDDAQKVKHFMDLALETRVKF